MCTPDEEVSKIHVQHCGANVNCFIHTWPHL